VEVLIFFVLPGLIPAAIASNKGRSFALWWLYGASLFIVALPMALLMKPKQVATPKEGSRDITAKARPDNYVPGWLVLVVFVALGGFIWFMANGGSSESSASSSSAVASVDAGSPQGTGREVSKAGDNTAKAPATESAHGAKWIYNVSTDSMSGKKNATALIVSRNSLHLSFPYTGKNYGHLIVRKHPQYGLDVIVLVDKGQILCDVYTCKLKIRFDDGPVQNFTMAPSADHSSTVVFAKYPQWAIKRLRKAKKVLIQVPMYQEGNQVLKFDVNKSLIWPPR